MTPRDWTPSIQDSARVPDRNGSWGQHCISSPIYPLRSSQIHDHHAGHAGCLWSVQEDSEHRESDTRLREPDQPGWLDRHRMQPPVRWRRGSTPRSHRLSLPLERSHLREPTSNTADSVLYCQCRLNCEAVKLTGPSLICRRQRPPVTGEPTLTRGMPSRGTSAVCHMSLPDTRESFSSTVNWPKTVSGSMAFGVEVAIGMSSLL